MIKRNWLAATCIALLSLSCTDAGEQVLINHVNGVWPKDSVQRFQWDIRDTREAKNIIFVVRNNGDYPYSNLRLIVDFAAENSKKREVDTLNYILAKPSGEWLGKGFGDTKEILFQYRLAHRFPKAGHYTLGLKQAMRADTLRGIEDIGVQIETAKP